MSLKTELDVFRSEFMGHVPPEIRQAMVRTGMELAASGIAQRALKTGDRVPDFTLRNARAGYVRLKDLFAEVLTALRPLSKQQRGEHHANASRWLLKRLPQPQADAGC